MQALELTDMILLKKSAVRSCLALAVAAAALLPSSSVAAEPSRRDHTPQGTLTFSCSSPAASLRIFGSESAGYRAVVLVATVGAASYYAGSGFLEGAPTDTSYIAGHLLARIPVRRAPMPSAPTVGVLTVSADLVEGRLQVLHSSGKGSGDANSQLVSVSRHRSVEPDGDVHLVAPDGAEALIRGCSGTLSMGASSVSSDPHATVDTRTYAEAVCEPVSVGDKEYSLFVPPTTTPPETAELQLVWFDGEWETYDVGSAGDGSSLDSWMHGVSFDLTDGTGTTGAVADVRFVADETSTVPISSGTWTSRLHVTIGRVVGTLTFPGGVVAPVSCSAYSIDDRYVQAGGTPSAGPAPSNDLPTSALPLAVGGQATVSTAGAAPAPEVPLECMTDPESGADWATTTVWYTVSGDGPVTIDTAGTRFDTAVAVYTQDGAGGFSSVPEACVDDTWIPLSPLVRALNLQASVTFDASPGTTYFVQIAGTAADRNVGTLRVSAS